MPLERIFFIRSDRLGEFILSLPAIKLVKENYPASKIFLLAKKDNIDLVKKIGFIDYFFEYKEDFFEGLRGSFRLADILKKEKIDCVISLNPKKEFHLASFLARVPKRVGYARKWGFCLNLKIMDRKFLEEKHEVEYNIELVSLICKKVFIPKVEFFVEDVSLDRVKKKLKLYKRYFVFHPFSSDERKKINKNFWFLLLERVKKIEEVVVIGSQDEYSESKVFEERGAINLTGDLDINQLTSFLKYHAKALIGLDSAPLHLANFLNIPVVGLYKITNPRRWGPFYGLNSKVIKEDKDEDFIPHIDEILKFLLQV